MEDQRPVTFPKRIGRTSDGQEDSGGDEELKLPVNRELGFSVEFEKERNDFASRIALQNEQSSFRGAEEEDEFASATLNTPTYTLNLLLTPYLFAICSDQNPWPRPPNSPLF